MKQLRAEPISAEAFAPFGDILSAEGPPDRLINAGLCGRYHDRARLDFAGGRAGISIFHAQIRALPYRLDLIERHPLGAQAFLPLSPDPFLVIVAAAKDAPPRTFITQPFQGVNLLRGVWHGVLTPLSGTGLFAVVDRIGEEANLEEYSLPEPYEITI